MTRQKIVETIERLDRLANTPQFMLVDEASEAARDALTLLRVLSGSHAEEGNAIFDTLCAFDNLDRERKAVKP